MSIRNERLVPQVVLAEAAELFKEQGYHRTRMHDIAARFGVTHAALYYHFEGKQDILAQINLNAVRQLLEAGRTIASQDLSAASRFSELLRNHLLWVAKNAPLASSLFDFDHELPPDLGKEINALRREYTSIFLDAYAKGKQDGSLTDVDPRVAIAMSLGAANWIYRWYDPSGPISPGDLAESGLEFLRAGFLA